MGNKLDGVDFGKVVVTGEVLRIYDRTIAEPRHRAVALSVETMLRSLLETLERKGSLTPLDVAEIVQDAERRLKRRMAEVEEFARIMQRIQHQGQRPVELVHVGMLVEMRQALKQWELDMRDLWRLLGRLYRLLRRANLVARDHELEELARKYAGVKARRRGRRRPSG